MVTGVRYYPLPGGGTAIRTGSGSAYTYALLDPHGTPSLYLDNTAQVPTWRQYTPYGDPRGQSAAAPDNRGFLNAPVNTATGLIHVGAREYDASAGRFISVDPVQDTADPQQWNGYAYASNNPTTRSDPTGLRVDGDRPGCAPSNGGSCGGYSMPDPGPCTSDSTCTHSTVDSGDTSRCDASCAKQQNALGKNSVPLGWLRNNGYRGSKDFTYDDAFTFAKSSPTAEVFVCEHVLHGSNADCGDNTASINAPWWEYLIFFLLLALSPLAVRGPEGEEIAPGRPSRLLAAGPDETEAAASKKFVDAAESAWGCSFDPRTPVLMADGSAKPIGTVKVGDHVKAADPATAASGSRPVTMLHSNADVYLADVTVHDEAGHEAVVHTTENHPFWDLSTRRWTPAGHLHPGDRLWTDSRAVVTVVVVVPLIRPATMLNLTVSDMHTYYVMAGETPVLVHNEGGGDRIIGTDDLTPDQLSNYNRYIRKLPAAAEGTVITRGANGAVQFETKVPGRVPGSYALYTKTIGSDGTTVGYNKTTIVPDGSVAHVKDKFNLPGETC